MYQCDTTRMPQLSENLHFGLDIFVVGQLYRGIYKLNKLHREERKERDGGGRGEGDASR